MVGRSPLFLDLETGVSGIFVEVVPAKDGEVGFVNVVIIPFNSIIPKKVVIPYSIPEEDIIRVSFKKVKEVEKFLEEEVVLRISKNNKSKFLSDVNKTLIDKLELYKKDLESCKNQLSTERKRREDAEKNIEAYKKNKEVLNDDKPFNTNFDW